MRQFARTASNVETFGAPVVRLRGSGTFPHVVAVLSARTPAGQEITISEGGARLATATRARSVTIRLISQATSIPRGSILRLRIAGTSGDLLYVNGVPSGTRLRVENVRITLPTLRTPISRP